MDTLYFKPSLARKGEDLVSETRQGYPFYDGSPMGIEEWKFKVVSKYAACAE